MAVPRSLVVLVELATNLPNDGLTFESRQLKEFSLVWVLLIKLMLDVIETLDTFKSTAGSNNISQLLLGIQLI